MSLRFIDHLDEVEYVERIKEIFVSLDQNDLTDVVWAKLASIDPLINHIKKLTGVDENSKNEKTIYGAQLDDRLFYDKDCLLNLMNNNINRLETRILNKKHLQSFDFKGHLKYVYCTSNKKNTVRFLSFIGIALPLLYIFKKSYSQKW